MAELMQEYMGLGFLSSQPIISRTSEKHLFTNISANFHNITKFLQQVIGGQGETDWRKKSEA
jgi:hypothetical protein